MKKNHFTMIELLVVISIIIILITILLPALGQIQKHAMKLQCMANLKTLMQIHSSYTSEQNGFFPAGTESGNTNGYRWVKVIPLSAAGLNAPKNDPFNWKTYGGKLTCRDNSGWWFSEEKKTNTILSYAINDYASGKAKKIERIKRPSYVGYFVEGNILYCNGRKYGPLNTAGSAYLNIHGNGITCAFVDGHVEYIESQKFKDQGTYRFHYAYCEE